MKNRCIAILLALSVFLPLAVAACGLSDSSDKTTSTQTSVTTSGKSEVKKLVKLTFWRSRSDGATQEYFLSSIARYEKMHGNIKIECADAPHGAEIDIKISTAFAAGLGPDIIDEGISSISPRVNQGQYAAVDKYIKNWADKDDMIDYVFETAKYDGKIYGVTYAPDPQIYVYRKDYFIEAGLDPERPPKNWEELLLFAEKLTKKDGDMKVRAGFNLPVDDSRIIGGFVQQNGGSTVDKNNEPTLNTKEWVETLKYLTQLHQKAAIPITQKENDQQDLFASGKAAMACVPPGAIAKMINSDPAMKQKIGTFFPENKKGGIFCGARLLFIGSQSKNEEEAWKYIEFVMGADEMKTRYEATKKPVVRKSLKDYYINSDPFLNGAVLKCIEVGVGSPKVPWSAYYFSTYLPTIQQEAYYGKKSPEQAIKDNFEKLQKFIVDTKK